MNTVIDSTLGAALVGFFFAAFVTWLSHNRALKQAHAQARHTERLENQRWQRERADQDRSERVAQKAALFGHLLVARVRTLELLEAVAGRGAAPAPEYSPAHAAGAAYAIALLSLGGELRSLAKAFYLETATLQLTLESRIRSSPRGKATADADSLASSQSGSWNEHFAALKEVLAAEDAQPVRVGEKKTIGKHS